MTPRATVRLQLTPDFGFDAARATIDYYAALGISHFYLSPIFRATKDSTHGYDAVDVQHISDVLGGRSAFENLAHALRERGLGIVLDIVPNHMGVASNDNAWWNDVLAHGESSRYARHFDIDWAPEDPALRGKVLLPFLGEPFADALESGALRVARDGEHAFVAYGPRRWPLSPESSASLGDPAAYDAHDADGRERLERLLAAQHYRLDSWRSAAARINYRRFFNIAELAALRVEDAAVFDDVHREILALYAQGLIDGVRVDHVDGLAFPVDYCARLRAALEACRPQRPLALRDAPPYIVVEKIFAAHEPQRDWGVAGTTGYDFMDQVGAIVHNPAGLGALDVLWRRVGGRPWEWRSAVFEARGQMLEDSFGADLARVVRAFHALAQRQPGAVHLSDVALKRALTALVIAFPVYRSYGMPGALPPEDAAVLAQAAERANRELAPQDYEALDFVARHLRERAETGAEATELDSLQQLAAVRFQQLTGPIAAKAIEDTVFYRELRLISRNEVGSDPNQFSLPLDEFHAACAVRAQRFPLGLIATATHDHKRGEDTRLRIAILSDDAERWSETCTRWMALNAARRPIANGSAAPDAIDETMLYQTLVGCWPQQSPDAGERDTVRRRLATWWVKALREAKRHTGWTAQNSAYEDACLAFLRAVLEDGGTFAQELDAFVATIGAAAALAGLAQTFLRLTTPGVPDLYQGCEFWDFSLVDPDNRRAVDYHARTAAQSAWATPLPDLLPDWADGRVKQALIARLNAHRAANPALYAGGGYTPLAPSGAAAAHVVAFERRAGAARLIAVASRWPLSLTRAPLDTPLIPPDAWQDTALALPDAPRLHDVLHDRPAPVVDSALRLDAALRDFPVALYFAVQA